MLQRSVDAPGRPLSQLPVLGDATPVRSFVTAPPPPTARPALPVVPAGDGVVQRAVGSTTDRPTSTGAGSSVADGAAPVTTSGDAHDGPGPAATAAPVAEVAHTGSSTSGAPSLPDAPERAPLLADAPALEVPGEVTSVTDGDAPTVSRLATGSAAPDGPAAPRRLGLGAPLPTPPGPVVQRSPEAGPGRLGLGAPLTRPPQQRVPDPPDAGPVVQMLSASGPDARPAAIGPSTGDPVASGPTGPDAAESLVVQQMSTGMLPAVEPTPDLEHATPPSAPEAPPSAPDPASPGPSASVEPAPWWPAAPERSAPLLGDHPIATALPAAPAAPAVQRSAVDEVVPIHWGEPLDGPGASAPGPQQGHPAGSGWQQGHPAGTPATTAGGAGAGAGPGAPATGQASVQRARAGTDPGSAAIRAGVAHRASDGSVVFAAPTDGPPTGGPPTDGPGATVQRFGLPSMPKLPTVPSLPSMPSLPSVPSMPSLPSGLPNMPSGLPNMPSGLPNMPNMPSLPNLPSGLPSLPNIPGLPSGLPSLPGLPSPSGIPDLSSIPATVDQLGDGASSMADPSGHPAQ